MGFIGGTGVAKIRDWTLSKLKAWLIAYDNRASGLLSNAVQYAIDEVLGKVWETERNIAPMEYSPAESSHAVGEYITYNDHLYKVISAISIGQTLQIGTNIQQVSMGNEITDLNSDITKTRNFTISLTNGTAYQAGAEYTLGNVSSYGITSGNVFAITLQNLGGSNEACVLYCSTSNGNIYCRFARTFTANGSSKIMGCILYK